MALGKLEPRNLLVADECHTLEKQIISFVEVLINRETLDNWAPAARPVPRMECLEEFADWLQDPYLNQCKERLEMLGENIAAGDHVNKKMQDEFNRLKNHIGRLLYAINDMTHRADDWIFWQEMPIKEKEWQYTAKPLYADSFIPLLIEEMGGIRLYMSAYPGPKDVFCRNLGLNPRQTAWLELDSTFPVDNRLIHMTTVGSMSRRYLEQTLPKLFKMCETILEAHPHDKGIIHCNSYALGQHIYGFLKSTAMRSRVLFAAKAQERSTHFNLHRTSPDPTVILSPSMAEGFSFDDNLARFQIIAKCPFPCIGDRQVAAKMKLDQDWYTLQTVQTCIQAAGRIVRSDTDFGATYILDSDFIRLYRQNEKFFPKWWVDALRFYSM